MMSENSAENMKLLHHLVMERSCHGFCKKKKHFRTLRRFFKKQKRIAYLGSSRKKYVLSAEMLWIRRKERNDLFLNA